jgi:hypothetical protein
MDVALRHWCSFSKLLASPKSLTQRLVRNLGLATVTELPATAASELKCRSAARVELDWCAIPALGVPPASASL